MSVLAVDGVKLVLRVEFGFVASVAMWNVWRRWATRGERRTARDDARRRATNRRRFGEGWH